MIERHMAMSKLDARRDILLKEIEVFENSIIEEEKLSSPSAFIEPMKTIESKSFIVDFMYKVMKRK